MGWNVVTTADPSTSRNFSADDVTAHRERYERAAEFTEVVKGLWDSWEDTVLIGDKASGQFTDLDRVHALAHAGHHFKVRGPLNVPRSPRGQPVLIQVGGSEDGRNLAAVYAEAIFSAAQTREDGIAFAEDIRTRARAFGRTDNIVFLPGLGTMLASTEAEVARREQELWDLLPSGYGIGRVAGLLQIDPARLSLDEPLPDGLEIFVDQVVPLLRRKDIVRNECAGRTLREHLGPSRPENRYTRRLRPALRASALSA